MNCALTMICNVAAITKKVDVHGMTVTIMIGSRRIDVVDAANECSDDVSAREVDALLVKQTDARVLLMSRECEDGVAQNSREGKRGWV